MLCCVHVYQGTPGGPRTVTLAVAAGAGAGEGGEEGSSESKPVPSLPVYDFASGRHSDYDTKWEPFVAGNYLVSNCPGLSRLPPYQLTAPSPPLPTLFMSVGCLFHDVDAIFAAAHQVVSLSFSLALSCTWDCCRRC